MHGPPERSGAFADRALDVRSIDHRHGHARPDHPGWAVAVGHQRPRVRRERSADARHSAANRHPGQRHACRLRDAVHEEHRDGDRRPGDDGLHRASSASAHGTNFEHGDDSCDGHWHRCPASVPFSADIRLVPPGVILPPAQTPTPDFAVTPTPVSLNVPAIFDASASCGGAVTNGGCSGSSPITSYAWTFGDGSAGPARRSRTPS